MKTHFLKFSLLTAAIAAVSFTTSCVKEVEVLKEEPAITFINQQDGKIVLEPGSSDVVRVAFQTRFQIGTEIVLSGKKADWVKVELEGQNTIVITPSEDFIDEDKTADFVISAPVETRSRTKEILVYKPQPVSFTVSRAKRPVEFKPAFEFVKAEDKALVLEPNSTESYFIEIKSDFPVEGFSIKEKENKTWCTAAFVDQNRIEIKPSRKFRLEDQEAIFVVAPIPTKANILYKPTPVEIAVSRGKAEPYINVTGEGLKTDPYVENIFTFSPAPTSPKALKLKIDTNLDKWFINDMNQVMDDNWQPVEWYSIDKKIGEDGAEVNVTFTDNATADDRMTTLMFTQEEGGYEGLVTISVVQSAKPATMVKVISSWPEEELQSPYELEFEKDAAGMAGSFDFEIEKDGSIAFKFVKAGTDEPDTEAENWIGISSTPYGSKIVPTKNNTGADRRIDLIILPAGGQKELFRFKITQAGN